MLLGGGWLALTQPMIFLGVLIAFILVMIWLIPKLWRGIKMMLKNIGKVVLPE